MYAVEAGTINIMLLVIATALLITLALFLVRCTRLKAELADARLALADLQLMSAAIPIDRANEATTRDRGLHEALIESKIREQQRASELATLMEATPAAVLIARDRSCDVVVGNPESDRLLQLTPGTNASANDSRHKNERPFQEFCDGKPLASHQLPMQRAATEGEIIRGFPLELRFHNGEIKHTLGNAAPLRDSDGNIVGAVAAFVDVTDLRMAEREIREQAKRKDEFIATLAHELRNPLATIQWGFNILGLNAEANGLDQIQHAMQRQMTQLVRLLDDLLDVSRITSGKFELRRAPCELREIIDVVVEGTHILIEELDHHFLVSLPSEPLRLNADLVRVAQIIGNLIGNAAKYTPSGGEIALIAERDGDWIDIRVSDNGIGMEPEILGEIFELFSQAQHAELRRRGGIGVGLALARSLTEMHGGFLRADSKGRGAGSTFTLRLPLLTTAPQPATTDANAMAPTLRKRVLILDDNVDAAKTLGHLLTLMGHDIVLAHTGLDAVSIAKEFHPQIALLDIGLPDIDGHEVARRIRQANLDTLLVAVTGWGAEADRENSLKAGFDVHLTKPVSLTEINALL